MIWTGISILDSRVIQYTPFSRFRRSLEMVALSPLGEREGRTGVFFSRGGLGEGVVGCHVVGAALVAALGNHPPTGGLPLPYRAGAGRSRDSGRDARATTLPRRL